MVKPGSLMVSKHHNILKKSIVFDMTGLLADYALIFWASTICLKYNAYVDIHISLRHYYAVYGNEFHNYLELKDIYDKKKIGRKSWR